MEIGTETIPVLVMQASLTGQAKDWSSDVSITVLLSQVIHRQIVVDKYMNRILLVLKV